MQKAETTEYILSARDGDEIAREKLILHYKPYIINTVGHICKRYITWSDEESSIGLIAFNRAIDTYAVDADKTFLNYVYLLVKRDLIDHFRREKKKSDVPLEVKANDEQYVNVYEIEKSMDSYKQNVQQQELITEILELSELLNDFNVKFEELEKFSPKHRKTQRKLVKIAEDFVQSSTLVETFLKKKRLPVSDFVKEYGYRLKTIEKYRKYIVTLILLKLHPEWQQLSSYISVPSESEGKL
ncbi:RNA polymerase sigma factor SigI [Paraliobacillus quinghaiensis]|uniref:RNA polymerase sigma factor SigI n=1 Tax=Paraliobacillus quinghaiensis TaxID=470815 RepID=A0A917WZ71_9BACI|nr:sigma factor [Paraliobacillus quinghaiensis]GGM42677.1 RNA polymerase sigma factor SigI [Paraliobacillus quinghaiensis]